MCSSLITTVCDKKELSSLFWETFTLDLLSKLMRSLPESVVRLACTSFALVTKIHATGTIFFALQARATSDRSRQLRIEKLSLGETFRRTCLNREREASTIKPTTGSSCSAMFWSIIGNFFFPQAKAVFSWSIAGRSIPQRRWAAGKYVLLGWRYNHNNNPNNNPNNNHNNTHPNNNPINLCESGSCDIRESAS